MRHSNRRYKKKSLSKNLVSDRAIALQGYMNKFINTNYPVTVNGLYYFLDTVSIKYRNDVLSILKDNFIMIEATRNSKHPFKSFQNRRKCNSI